MPRTKKAPKAPILKESAQNIWLAGLGAFALAGEEGEKVFSTLVKKGAGLEKANKQRLAKVLSKVGDLRDDAGRAIGKLTAPIDNATSTTLHRLGVPTRKEITTLTKRVEELTRTVERTKGRARRKTRRTRKTTA
ncbi:MAG: phasin family protein [Gemmatimonadales bacterium]